MCIAEVEELVEPGQLDPDEIHLPGIYVQRIIKGTSFDNFSSVATLAALLFRVLP